MRFRNARPNQDRVQEGSPSPPCPRGVRTDASDHDHGNRVGEGKGRFRTRGRYAAATVRGTTWLTVDRCDGTFVRVVAGKVQVNDFVKRKTVLVAAGKSYLAKKR